MPKVYTFLVILLINILFVQVGTQSITISNCVFAANSGGRNLCLQCIGSYVLSQDQTKCISAIANCQSQVQNQCQQCKQGYRLNSDEDECTQIPDLQQCDESSGGICTAQSFKSQKALEQYLQTLKQTAPAPAFIQNQEPIQTDGPFIVEAQNQNNNTQPQLIRAKGFYLYTFQNRIFSIFRSYPADQARLISSLEINLSIQGLFIGDRYACLYGGIRGQRNRINIYLIDISDKSSPSLYKTYTISGIYFDSRLTPEGYLYFVTKQSLSKNGIPWYNFNGRQFKIPAQSYYIYNPRSADYQGIFLTIFSFKLDEPDSAASGLATLITQNSRAFYMTDRSMYITYPKLALASDRTIIHKIFLQRSKIIPYADNFVSGTVNDRYSLDEYQNNLRIATSSIFLGYNIMTIFDNDLNQIGNVDKFGIQDRIFAVRFTENRCYISTFNRIDPFYVIGLQNPRSPQILGQVEITGFSRHIFLYDQNTVVGIGRDSTQQGQILGLKVVLMDVSDPKNPKNVSQTSLGHPNITSSAQFDRRGILLSRTKNTLIIPAKLDQGQLKLNGAIIYYIDSSYVQYRSFQSILPQQYNRINDYTVQRSIIIEEMTYLKSKCTINIFRTYNLEYIKTMIIPPCE